MAVSRSIQDQERRSDATQAPPKNTPIDFVFINPHNPKYDEYSRLMAKHLKPVNIKNVADFVHFVLGEVSRTGKKIGSITLVGHAGNGELWIGDEIISSTNLWLTKVNGKAQKPHGPELIKLNVHFAPGAEVRFLQCNCAYYTASMQLLSVTWPTARVVAWTGKIRAYEDQYEAEGTLVACRMGGCSE
jgi:hypothetical protein